MFKAGDVAETGKLDFANYSGSMNTYALFYNTKSFNKVCLPASLTFLDGLAFNSTNITKVWVSGSARRCMTELLI